MGIPRSTLLDDDGTLTVGSPWNNAELQKIYDNIDAYFGTPRVTLAKSTTEQIVTNSNVLTSVFSFSVPGGLLSTSGVLLFQMTGYIDLSAVSANLTLTIAFGGTTIASGVIVTTAACKGPVRLFCEIAANGASNAQRCTSAVHQETDGASTTDAAWSAAASTTVRQSAHSTLAIDTTIAKTFDVSVQWGNVAATSIFKRWAAHLELVRP